MSKDMRQELLGLKGAVDSLGSSVGILSADVKDLRVDLDALGVDVKGLRVDLDALGVDVKGLRVDLDALGSDVKGLRVDLDALGSDVKNLRTDINDMRGTMRSLVIVVARHEERFDRIDEKLKKLDVLDQMKGSMDALAGELASSRRERALSDISFRDHRDLLTDHELRLVRLERRDKPS
ncbi:MAG: hypothetical protein HKL90_01845 [Elusimicrobia bacterium]|nr:hypothetical protein [Elusimicrobiota bacterium]